MRKDVQEFLRKKIILNLRLCDDAQITLFGKFYGPVMVIPANKLEAALDLCERTNKKRGRRIEEP